MKSNTALQVFKINWTWGSKTELWTKHMLKNRTILNIPCGKSQVGNIRADIDPTIKPDLVCDIHALPFRPQSFDAVLCDPPFSLYNKWKWVNRLSHIAKRNLLLSIPASIPYLKGFKKELYATIHKSNFFVRYWVFYTKRNHEL